MNNKQLHPFPFVADMMEATYNMWRAGWDERNGGNISCIIDEQDIVTYLGGVKTERVLPLQTPAPELAGKYFIVTGTGKYFKNVIKNPEENLGIIQVLPEGKSIGIIWGFTGNTRPTSELSAHFLSHIERLKADPQHRVIIHNHATYTLAMTYSHKLDEAAFTKTLWQMCTECLVVFPDGVSILPWLVPGTAELGKATAEKMRDFRIVIWPQHGILGAGKDMDEAFGLIETVEKAAQIYMLASAHKNGILNVISDENLLELAEAFQVTPRKGIISC